MKDLLSISCPHCLTTNRVPTERLSDAPKCGRCHKALFEAEPVQLNDLWLNTFLMKTELPLLIDFWAPWCGPCLKMEPEFAAAAAELEPYIRVGRINTEQNELVSARHNIRSIPTIILFERHKEVARHTGVMNKANIVSWVKASSSK